MNLFAEVYSHIFHTIKFKTQLPVMVKKRISELAGKLEELFSDREIKLLFRQRAKRIVEEMKKCITPISFFEDLIYYAT